MMNTLPFGITGVRAGIGEDSYTMRRGSFTFKEKKLFSVALRAGEPDGGTVPLINGGETYLYARVRTEEKDGKGEIDVEFTPAPGHEDINRLSFFIPAEEGEAVWGCGETFAAFDLRGKKQRVWVAEHVKGSSMTSKIAREKLTGPQPRHRDRYSSYETYYAQPSFTSSRKYFFHIDTNAYCEFDFTRPDRHKISMRSTGTVHIRYAKTYADVLFAAGELLGRQPELPDYVYDGVILGVQGGTAILEKKIAAALAHGTPVTGVWCQDWEGRRVTAFGKQLMWNWRFEPELYPDLPEEIKSLNERGIRFLGYINPFLAVEKELYKYASEKGYCVKDKHGDDYLVTITTFPAAMVDLTNPDAREWLKGIIKTNMIGIGMSGWMADFGEYLPTDSVLYSGEDARRVHCAWPAMWARLNREAIEETGNLGRIFFFTRAGHTGSVKYSTMMWTGDQHVDWSEDYGFGCVIPATLSLAMSGYGLTHSDMGGYTTLPPIRRSKELFIRWCEASCFSPLMRSHEGNRPDFNVQFDADDEVLEAHARLSRAHKALAPYIKECVRENSESSMPVMRPLFLESDEPRFYGVADEYMLGPDVLVAPVLEQGANGRTVVLPRGKWVRFFTGEEYEGGGEVEADAPLGVPCAFYKKESKYALLFGKTVL
ncbi:MAG: alpha-glucosidase [Clostridiales bacterium]|nr:alpha-glucosidase [Clostridiales bacterium]